MTEQMSKEMKKNLNEAEKYIESKMVEILTEIDENFNCEIHARMLSGFAHLFMKNAIANYMHHNGLDKTNKEHRALILDKAIESSRLAAQEVFELCDDCMNNTSHIH